MTNFYICIQQGADFKYCYSLIVKTHLTGAVNEQHYQTGAHHMHL